MTMNDARTRRLRELLDKWKAEATKTRVKSRGKDEDYQWTADTESAIFEICADELAAVLDTEGDRRMDDDFPPAQVQLLAWAVSNCHTLARRALAHDVNPASREKWEHVLRICEKAGARSKGVLRMALPTEITDGSRLDTEGDRPTLVGEQQDEELTPHAFLSREGNEIWCQHCEYHQDHRIHRPVQP